MKNGPLFFLGLFAALAISWGGVVLSSHGQLGDLAPYFDETDGVQPARTPGVALRGQLVYADLGCAACHTQQVRRAGFGSDIDRKWGERQSVARDYIFQIRPQLGNSRIGPDLANVGGRKPAYDTEDLTSLLYTGVIPGTKAVTHPTYKFLFTDREIVGERTPDALKLKGDAAPAAGREIVPTERARTLVAYLLGSNQAYSFPEAKPLTVKAAPAAKKADADHAHDAKPEAKK